MKFNCILSTDNWSYMWSVILLLVLCSIAQAGQEHRYDHRAVQSDTPKIVQLLDFNSFKTVFHKNYSSILDEVSRRRIYLAKCFISYISIIKYKLGKSTSYRSINHMSDWTREEWRRTLMKPDALRPLSAASETTYNEDRVHEEGASIGSDVLKAVDLERLGIDDEINVERKMIDLATEFQGREKDASLRKVSPDKSQAERRHADLGATRAGNDVSDLLAGVVSQIDHDERRQTAPNVQKMPLDQAKSSKMAPKGNFNVPSAGRSVTKTKKVKLHGEIYDVDHRGCFNEVKSQADCGSCYVFAAIAVLECLYFRSSGRKVEFSEQYALDCGDGTCTGGWPRDIIDFSSQYGIDTAENFPYFARARKCTFGKPIGEGKIAGYFRLTGLSYHYVPMSALREEIVHGPILFIISLNDEFSEYGGGVDELKNCVHGEDQHAMVLVGHGQENGVDFWLARNSYSSEWGENGYYKFSQDALERCLVDDERNSVLVEGDNVKFRKNRHYDIDRMERLKQKWLERQLKREQKETRKKKKS